MSVKTGGPVRGFIARWMMRVQAVQGHLQLVGIGITAASTLTSALVLVGAQQYAPYLLTAGLISVPAYAWAYVELGVLNRKNRENMDRASNFSGPNMLIDDILIANAVFAAREGRPPTEEERAVMRQAVKGEWNQFRDGANLDGDVADA